MDRYCPDSGRFWHGTAPAVSVSPGRRPFPEVGMRKVLFQSIAVCGVLLGAATISNASTLGLDVTSDTQIFAPGVFHNIGWQFQVNAPVTVDGLGLFDVNPAGLSESHQVGLWDNSGNLLAQTTVTSG